MIELPKLEEGYEWRLDFGDAEEATRLHVYAHIVKPILRETGRRGASSVYFKKVATSNATLSDNDRCLPSKEVVSNTIASVVATTWRKFLILQEFRRARDEYVALSLGEDEDGA